MRIHGTDKRKHVSGSHWARTQRVSVWVAAAALLMACGVSSATAAGDTPDTTVPVQPDEPAPAAARQGHVPVAPVGVCPEPSTRELRYTPSSSEHRSIRFLNAAGATLYVNVLAAASSTGGREVLHGVLSEGGSLSVRAAMRSKWLVRTGRGRLLRLVHVTAELPADVMVTPCRSRNVTANVVFSSEMPRVAHFQLSTGRAGGIGLPKAGADPSRRDVSVSFASLMHVNSMDLEWDRKVLCPVCHGTRYPPNFMVPCDTCGGTGLQTRIHTASDCHLHANPYDGAASGARFRHNVSTTCDACHGFGVVPRSKAALKCAKCGGNGTLVKHEFHKLVLPAGVRSDMVVVMAGAGDTLSAFHKPQDIHVAIKVAESDVWERDGDDLVYKLEISLAEALFGYTRNYTHINGAQMVLKRSSSTPHGYTRRLLGGGLPRLPPQCEEDLVRCANQQLAAAERGPAPVGDLLVKHVIVFPQKVSYKGASRLMSAFPSLQRKRKWDERQRRARQMEEEAAQHIPTAAGEEGVHGDDGGVPGGAGGGGHGQQPGAPQDLGANAPPVKVPWSVRPKLRRQDGGGAPDDPHAAAAEAEVAAEEEASEAGLGPAEIIDLT